MKPEEKPPTDLQKNQAPNKNKNPKTKSKQIEKQNHRPQQ